MAIYSWFSCQNGDFSIVFLYVYQKVTPAAGDLAATIEVSTCLSRCRAGMQQASFRIVLSPSNSIFALLLLLLPLLLLPCFQCFHGLVWKNSVPPFIHFSEPSSLLELPGGIYHDMPYVQTHPVCEAVGWPSSRSSRICDLFGLFGRRRPWGSGQEWPSILNDISLTARPMMFLQRTLQ